MVQTNDEGWLLPDDADPAAAGGAGSAAAAEGARRAATTVAATGGLAGRRAVIGLGAAAATGTAIFGATELLSGGDDRKAEIGAKGRSGSAADGSSGAGGSTAGSATGSGPTAGTSTPPPVMPTKRSPRRTADVNSGDSADRDQSYARGGSTSGAGTTAATGRLLSGFAEAARAAGLLSTSPPQTDGTNPTSPLEHSVFFSQVTPGMPGVADAERHALRRLTFGPTAADRAAVAHLGLDAWISRQLQPNLLSDAGEKAALANFPMIKMSAVQVFADTATQYQAATQVAWATMQRQMFSSRQLYEIVVDVFANLQNIGMPTSEVNETAPDWNRNVIRKYAFGRYEDMLLAAARHPAMMQFLNNDQSNKANVNENYGRELLELHTVGVASGYTEHDVRNSAYILSGRSRNWQDGTFVYNADDHWTGPVTVLGFHSANTSAAGGLAVGDAYLRYLANHPGTAQTVARKLAVRFVSDNPPASLVNRMAQAYLKNGTAIVPVLEVMLRSTEFWAAVGQKTRRPAEDVIGAVRALGITTATAQMTQDVYWLAQSMGNAPLGWAPPNGYPDVAAAWRSAIGLVQRWNEHVNLAAGWSSLKPPTDPAAALKASTSLTWSAYLDRVAVALIGQTLRPAHRDALVKFLGVSTGAKVDANQSWKAPYVTALVLDSAYFQLR